MKVNLYIKSSFAYIVATLIGQGMSFLGIIVFTRIMGQGEYGRYSTYYAYVSMLTVLIGGNLYFALNNAYIDKKTRILEFRKSALMLSVILALCVFIVLEVIGRFVLRMSSFYLSIFIALHSYSFFVICYRTYSANMENDYKRKSWLLILPNAFQFILSLFFVIVFPTRTFEGRVIGSVLGVAIVATPVFVEMMHQKGKLVNRDDWKYALSISIPSIAMSLSFMLMQQCDKVMITNICGAENTAVYSVIYYIGYAIIAVEQAISPVRQSWIYRKLDEKDMSDIKKLQKWYLILMGLIATGMLMVGPEVVKIIAPDNYWEFAYIAPFVASACVMILYSFYMEILLFYKENIFISVCVLICALLNIMLNAFLIPLVGAMSAAYTTVISYFLLFILTRIRTSKCIKGIYSNKIFFLYIIFIAMDIEIYYLTYERFIVRYVIYLAVIAYILIFVLREKEEWKNILWERR